MRKALFVLLAGVALGGCSLDKQSVPALSGPSEFALSLAMTATPDIISQDGASQSTIIVTARDANSQPVRGLSMRADIFVNNVGADFGTLSARTVQTGNDGRAIMVYTAPPPPPPGGAAQNLVTIRVMPIGSNFANEFPRTVDIQLVTPGVIIPGGADLVADFNISPTSPKAGETVLFTSASTVGSGRTIVSHAWSFGDGKTGSGPSTSHAFGPGSFAVTLIVTDDLGRSASKSKTVTVGGGTIKADFVFSPTDPFVGEGVVFSAASSKADPGRTIVSYNWTFGDGGGGGGVSPTHAFNQARTYTVVLTVTDDIGQSDTVSKTVAVKDLIADFSISPSDPAVGATVSFNAAGVKVAAGRTITNYDWDFGDATPHGPSAQAVTHAYGVAGTYTVVLTIRDSGGSTASVSKTVTVK